jgi:hypothetical protein
MIEHFGRYSGREINAAKWTSKFKPVKLISAIPLKGVSDEKEVWIYENVQTIRMISKYGIENVRGGNFTAVNKAQWQINEKYKDGEAFWHLGDGQTPIYDGAYNKYFDTLSTFKDVINNN